MAQNAYKLYWSREDVDEKLRAIMKLIHEKAVKYGKGKDGRVDYVSGVNAAAFELVARAMVAQGVV